MRTNPRTQTPSSAAKAVIVGIVCVLALLAVSQASAATQRYTSDCWRQVVNDWFVDGRVDGTYPIGCYTQAIAHVNQFEDVKAYSSAADDIRRALLAAVRADRGGGSNRGDAGGGPTGSSNGPDNTSGGASAGSSGHQGWLRAAIDKIGPSNAESVPLPLLILAGIALLLVAAAGASVVARRLQARRVQPAPAAVPRPRDRP
jgi:hypothetical protein